MRRHKVAMISAAENSIPAYCIARIREFADITCKHCENPAELAAFAKDKVILPPHAAAFSADFEKKFRECSVRKSEGICKSLEKAGK